MAIAGITIQTTAEAYGTVRERLCASKDVADTQETGVPGMLAGEEKGGAPRVCWPP